MIKWVIYLKLLRLLRKDNFKNYKMFFSNKLKKIKSLNHCFFSKKKGFSKGIYKGLNCGIGSKDNKKNVKKNLNKVSKYFNFQNKNLKLMFQTHSSKVIFINNKNKNKKRFRCDSMVTKIRGIGLGVLTADCVPVLLYDTNNHLVGCVHAGWKGALNGIIEKTINTFKKKAKNIKMIAAIGPCIAKKNYEVGFDFKRKMSKKEKNSSIFFKKKNKQKFYFDLRKYVNYLLKKSGVRLVDNINLDTYCDEKMFYSYRRSKKSRENDYGRLISVISLKKI
jgi:polyphenol oxidase